MEKRKNPPVWEDVAIYSLQAGMSLPQLRGVLEATGNSPEKPEWAKIRRVRRDLRPKLTRVGFRMAS